MNGSGFAAVVVAASIAAGLTVLVVIRWDARKAARSNASVHAAMSRAVRQSARMTRGFDGDGEARLWRDPRPGVSVRHGRAGRRRPRDRT
jgi:hypothetical protein